MLEVGAKQGRLRHGIGIPTGHAAAAHGPVVAERPTCTASLVERAFQRSRRINQVHVYDGLVVSLCHGDEVRGEREGGGSEEKAPGCVLARGELQPRDAPCGQHAQGQRDDNEVALGVSQRGEDGQCAEADER